MEKSLGFPCFGILDKPLPRTIFRYREIEETKNEVVVTHIILD